MALIKPIKNILPKIDKTCFIAENATIIGDVLIKENSSIWYNTVLRGDVGAIKIGSQVNIQDNAVVHCTYKKTNTVIGNNSSIGHSAIVHGCTIKEYVLIGMGAIVMDNVIIESNSIIAAGAVVTEGTIVESGSIYAGVPAKKIKQLAPNEVRKITEQTAKGYLKYAQWH